MTVWRIFLLTVLANVVATQLAHAQIVIPPSVEAGNLNRQFDQLPQPPSQQIPERDSKSATIPEGSENIKLVVESVELLGMEAYSSGHFDELINTLKARESTLADVYQLAGDIRRVYHDDGYILTQVFLPEQKIDKGHVIIQVVEGYIDEIKWTGEEINKELLEERVNKLTEQRPFSSTQLEETILLLNDFAGVTVRSSLAPHSAGSTAPIGAVGLVLDVAKKEDTITTDINNYGSRYASVWQGTLGVDTFHNLMDMDKLTVQLSSAADIPRQRYGSIRYSVPVHSSGTTLFASGSMGKVLPAYTLSRFEVDSESLSLTVGVTQPVWRTRKSGLTLNTQLNYSNARTKVLDTPFSRDKLRNAQLGFSYNVFDTFGGSNLLTANVFQGLDILKSTETGSRLLSRPRGHSDFTKGVVSVSRLQPFDYDASLLLSTTIQKSNSPLLSSEQFSFGGPSFGRGYDASEISGDEGFAAAAELRQNWSIDVVNIQPFTYIDVGRASTKSARSTYISAASAGVGARIMVENIQLEPLIAVPLTLTPATEKIGSQDNQPRFLFSIKSFF